MKTFSLVAVVAAVSLARAEVPTFVRFWLNVTHSTSLNRDISLVHPMQSEHNTGIAMGLHTGYIRTEHTHLISSNVRLAI